MDETESTTPFWSTNYTARFGSFEDESIFTFDNLTNNDTSTFTWWSSSTLLYVVVTLLSGAVSALTVFGNLLVLFSFLLERNLRIPSNYFIASLAVTDLLIGMFSIPAFTVTLVLQYWPGGILLCDLWLSLDYTVCLVSQYTVLLITIDRFCSVKIPAKYRVWRTRRRVKLLIMITWICPSILFGTIHLGWDYIKGYRSLTDKECAAQFITQAPIFNLALIFTYFWSTLVVLIALYVGIYHVAWQLARKAESKQKRMAAMMQLAGSNMTRITVGVAAQRGALGPPSTFENEIEIDEATKSVAVNLAARNLFKNGNNKRGALQVSVKSNQLTLPGQFLSTAGAVSTTFGTSSTTHSTTITGSSSLNTRSAAGGERNLLHISSSPDIMPQENSSIDDFNEDFDDDERNNTSAATDDNQSTSINIPPPTQDRRWFQQIPQKFVHSTFHSVGQFFTIRRRGSKRRKKKSVTSSKSDGGQKTGERIATPKKISVTMQNNKRREKNTTENDSFPEVSTTTIVDDSQAHHHHHHHHQKNVSDLRPGSVRSARSRPAVLLVQNIDNTYKLPTTHQTLVKSASSAAKIADRNNEVTQPITEYSTTSSTATTEVLIQNLIIQQQNPPSRRKQPEITKSNVSATNAAFDANSKQRFSASDSFPNSHFSITDDTSSSQAMATAAHRPASSAQQHVDTVIIAKELNDELRSMFARARADSHAAPPVRSKHGNAVAHSKSSSVLAQFDEIWLRHSSSAFAKPPTLYNQNGHQIVSFLPTDKSASSFNGKTPLHPGNDLRFIDSESILSPGSTASLSNSIMSFMNGAAGSYRPFAASYSSNQNIPVRMGRLGGARYYLKTAASAVSSSGYDLAVWQTRLPSPPETKGQLQHSTDNSLCTSPSVIMPGSFVTATNAAASKTVDLWSNQAKSDAAQYFQSPSPATSPSECDVSSTIMSVDESLLVAALPESEVFAVAEEKKLTFVDINNLLDNSAALGEILSGSQTVGEQTVTFHSPINIVNSKLLQTSAPVPTPPASVHNSSNQTFEQQPSHNINVQTEPKKIEIATAAVSFDRRVSKLTPASKQPPTKNEEKSKRPQFDEATAANIFIAQSYESNPPKFQLHPPPRHSGSRKQLSRVSSQYSDYNNNNNEADSGDQPNSSSLFYSSVNEEGIMFITDDAVSDYKTLHRHRSVRSSPRSPMSSIRRVKGGGSIGSKQQLDSAGTTTRTNSLSKKLRVKLQTPSSSKSKQKSKRHHRSNLDASRGENRARKALRTITVIMGAYLICWTPWHICATIIGLHGGDTASVSALMLNISTWLCYVNSPINPFCYAFANQQFKKTFLRILRGDFRRS